MASNPPPTGLPFASYVDFYKRNRKNPQWINAPPEVRERVYQKFQVKHPLELLRHPDLARQPVEVQVDLFNSVMEEHPDWPKMNVDQRRYLRSQFFKQKLNNPQFEEGLVADLSGKAAAKAVGTKIADQTYAAVGAPAAPADVQKDFQELAKLYTKEEFLAAPHIERHRMFSEVAKGLPSFQQATPEKRREMRSAIVENTSLPPPYREGYAPEVEGYWDWVQNEVGRGLAEGDAYWNGFWANMNDLNEDMAAEQAALAQSYGLKRVKDDKAPGGERWEGALPPEARKAYEAKLDRLKAVVDANVEAGSYAPPKYGSQASKDIQELGFWNWFGKFLNPFDKQRYSLQLVAESVMGSEASQLRPRLAQTAGAAAEAMIGGPAGLATGVATIGAGTFLTEFAGTLFEDMKKRGVDTSDLDQLVEAFDNEQFMSEVRGSALKRGIPVPLVDMLTYSVGRPFRAAKNGVVRAAEGAAGRKFTSFKDAWQWSLKHTKHAGLEVGGGVIGEILGQEWHDGGIVDPLAVIQEGFAELGQKGATSTASAVSSAIANTATFGAAVGGEDTFGVGRAASRGLKEAGREMRGGPGDVLSAAEMRARSREGETAPEKPLWTSKVDADTQAKLDGMNEDDRKAIDKEAFQAVNERLSAFMTEHNMKDPEEIPEGIISDIGAEVLAGLVKEYKGPAGATPAPEEVERTTGTSAKDWKAKARAAKTEAELDEIEAQWKASDKGPGGRYFAGSVGTRLNEERKRIQGEQAAAQPAPAPVTRRRAWVVDPETGKRTIQWVEEPAPTETAPAAPTAAPAPAPPKGAPKAPAAAEAPAPAQSPQGSWQVVEKDVDVATLEFGNRVVTWTDDEGNEIVGVVQQDEETGGFYLARPGEDEIELPRGTKVDRMTWVPVQPAPAPAAPAKPASTPKKKGRPKKAAAPAPEPVTPEPVAGPVERRAENRTYRDELWDRSPAWLVGEPDSRRLWASTADPETVVRSLETDELGNPQPIEPTRRKTLINELEKVKEDINQQVRTTPSKAPFIKPGDAKANIRNESTPEGARARYEQYLAGVRDNPDRSKKPVGSVKTELARHLERLEANAKTAERKAARAAKKKGPPKGGAPPAAAAPTEGEGTTPVTPAPTPPPKPKKPKGKKAEAKPAPVAETPESAASGEPTAEPTSPPTEVTRAPEAAATSPVTQPKTAKELEAQLMKARGPRITKAQVKATMELIAARAKALGKSADEFVRERILGVSEEKPTGPLVLWQTNTFPGASVQGPLSRAATNNLFLKSRRLIEGQTQKKWVGAQLYGWLQKQGISQTELEYLRLDELLEGSTEKVETDDVLTWIDRNFTLAIGEQGGVIGFGDAPPDPEELKAYQAELNGLASYLTMIEDAKLPVAGRIDSAATWYEFDMHYGALAAVREHIKNNWIPETNYPEGDRTGYYGPPDRSDERVFLHTVRGTDGRKIILRHEDLMRVYTAEMTRRQEAYRKFLFDPKKLAEAIAVRHESEWHSKRGIHIVTPLEGAADTARLDVSSDGTTITMRFTLEPPSDLRVLDTSYSSPLGKIFDARRMKDGTEFTTTDPEEAEKYFDSFMEDASAASRDAEVAADVRMNDLREWIDEVKSRMRPEGRYSNLIAGGIDEEGNNYFEVFVGDTAAWPTFRDGHWRDIPNTIMWIRGDVREIVINGKPIKVVYLHEQQGDLHKAAHHKISQRARDIAAQKRIPIEEARKEGATRPGPYARRLLGPVPLAARWEDLSGEDLVRYTVVRPHLDPAVSRAIGHATARGVAQRMLSFARGYREHRDDEVLNFGQDAFEFLRTGERGNLTQDEMAAVILERLDSISTDGRASYERLRPVMARIRTNWDGGPIEDQLKIMTPSLFEELGPLFAQLSPAERHRKGDMIARDVFSSAYKVINEALSVARHLNITGDELAVYRQRARDVIGEVSEALYMEHVLGSGDWSRSWTKNDITRMEREARVFGDHVRWLLGLNLTAEIEDRSDPERGSRETAVRGFSTTTNAQEMTTRFRDGQKSNRAVVYPEEKFPYVPYRSANDQAAIALKIALSLAERLGVEGVAWAGGNLQHNLWYKALAGRNSPVTGSIDVIEAATPAEWRDKVDETIHRRSGQDEWTIPEAENRSTQGVGRSYLVTTKHKDAGTTHQVFNAESGTNITDAYDTLAQWQQDGMEITALLKPETLKELSEAGPGPFRELTPADYVTAEDGFTQVYDTLMTRVMEKILKSLGIKQRVEHGVDEKLEERLKNMEEAHSERATWWRPDMAEAGISHFVRLSPEDLNAVRDRGLPYMQRSNAAVQFDAENRAMIHLFGEARNVSSLVHEVGHIFRRDLSDLSPTQLETLEKWAEVKGHRWTVKADEKFANAWEKYLRDGKAPTSELAKVFETFKKWMLNIYKTIKGSELDVDVPPEIAAIFDAMLGKEEAPDPTPAEPVETVETEETVEARGPPSEFPELTATLESKKKASGVPKASSYKAAIDQAVTEEELDFISQHLEDATTKGVEYRTAASLRREIAKKRKEIAEPETEPKLERATAISQDDLIAMLGEVNTLEEVRDIYGIYEDDLATARRTVPSKKFEAAHKLKLAGLRKGAQRDDLATRLGKRGDWPVGKRDWLPIERGTFIGVGRPMNVKRRKGETTDSFKARERSARAEYAADAIQQAWWETTRRMIGEALVGRIDPWFVAHALDAMEDEYKGDIPWQEFKNDVYDMLDEEQRAVDDSQWVAEYMEGGAEGTWRDFERQKWDDYVADRKSRFQDISPEDLAEGREWAKERVAKNAAIAKNVEVLREEHKRVEEHVGAPDNAAEAVGDTALSTATEAQIDAAMRGVTPETPWLGEETTKKKEDVQREIAKLLREQEEDAALDALDHVDTISIEDLPGEKEDPTDEDDPWHSQRGFIAINGFRKKAQLAEDQTADIRDQVQNMGAPMEQKNTLYRQFAPGKVARWFAQNFGHNRGLVNGLWDVISSARAIRSAGTTLARLTFSQVNQAMDALTARFPEDKVRNGITWVFQGKMPIEQFKRIFDVGDDHPAVMLLREIKETRDYMREQLLAVEGLPESLRQAIETHEDYMTRFYKAHILGEKFNVDTESWQNARTKVYTQIQQRLNDLTDRGTKLIGKEHPFDIVKFLRSDHDKRKKMVEKLSKTKARDLLAFGLSMDPYLQFLETMEVKGNRLQVSPYKDMLIQEAEHYLAFVLENARSKKGMGFRGPEFLIPVANQLHRELDAEFRKLLGQVETPAERIARTLEAQNNLLAAGLMFQQMFREGEGVWWSDGRVGRFERRLTETGSTDAPVTNADRRRYGAMAGKFVDQSTYDVLHNEGTFAGKISNQSMVKVALDLQARTRAMRLLWPKTMFRNALSSVVGFAFRSGDAMHSEFWPAWSHGWKLVAGLVAEEDWAYKELNELQRKGVFDYSQETMLNMIEQQMETWGKHEYLTKLGIRKTDLHRLMQYYALIDLPAKYAGYQIGLKLNKGDEKAAADHVHNYYQYSPRVPEFVHKLNKLPFGDYVGYTYDSGRIWSNATLNVAKSAAKGDVRPLFGYLLSALLPAANMSGGIWLAGLAPKAAATSAYFLGNALAQVLQVVSFDDDDLEKLRKRKFRVATDDEVTALRATLPSYDRFAPIVAWYVTDEDGQERLVYKILANTNAFPLEEVVMGAIQTAIQDKGHGEAKTFGRALIQNLYELLPFAPGMTPETLYKMWAGPFPGKHGLSHIAKSTQWQQSMDDPWIDKPSDTTEIVMRSVGEFVGMVFVPGQGKRVATDILNMMKDRDPAPGNFKKKASWSDVRRVIMDPVRSYEYRGFEQFSLLDKATRDTFENLRLAKSQAGIADRAAIGYKTGPTDEEWRKSQQGRQDWYDALKRLERRTLEFKTYTGGSWSDDIITMALQKMGGIKNEEARALVKGTVDQLPASNFQSQARTDSFERGAFVVREALRSDTDLETLFQKLRAGGYHFPGEEGGPGDWTKFSRWVRSERKKMREEEQEE